MHALNDQIYPTQVTKMENETLMRARMRQGCLSNGQNYKLSEIGFLSLKSCFDCIIWSHRT